MTCLECDLVVPSRELFILRYELFRTGQNPSLFYFLILVIATDVYSPMCLQNLNRLFSSCFEPHYESGASCEAFHNKNNAQALAFKMRFKTTSNGLMIPKGK